jgi:glycosyltransferase involved in cell wall biosynthesis
MTKILFLTDALGNGGAERQLALLLGHLPAEWDRRLWSMGTGPFVEVIRAAGVPVEVHERRWRYDIAPVLNLWKTVARRRPAIVHSWGGVCSAAVAPLCRLLRIPWIDGTIRLGWVPPSHLRRTRFAYALADRVVANSRAGLEAWGIPASRGRVIYNGFDSSRLPSAAGTRPGDGSFTAVMAARMSPSKDFAAFLEAARIVSARGPDGRWRFLAIGAGSDRQALIDGSSDLIEKGIVSFVDAGLEILPRLQAADAGVLMTNPERHAEGCSNSILEYMASGLPVVCSDGGGNRELVADGITGFVVPPGNAGALADRLMWLREHADEAAEMGRAGSRRVMTDFTVRNMVDRTVAVYRELLP